MRSVGREENLLLGQVERKTLNFNSIRFCKVFDTDQYVFLSGGTSLHLAKQRRCIHSRRGYDHSLLEWLTVQQNRANEGKTIAHPQVAHINSENVLL